MMFNTIEEAVDDIANGTVDLAVQPTVEIAVSVFDPDPPTPLTVLPP